MFAFVILNYNSYDLTLNCIEKIRKLKEGNKAKIIVVDNATLTTIESNNLKKQCDKLIVNKKNLGFAKGNNIGITYAKENYKSNFICVLNSDCMISQNDFLLRIKKIYKENSFDILGPKIHSFDGLSWNPFPVYQDLEQVNHKIKYHEKILKIYKNKVLYFLLNVYLFFKIKKEKIEKNGNQKEEKVALHGCCLIFSKKYIEAYKDAFYPETFLYHEEEFLYYRMIKDNLKFIYDPQIEVTHLEGIATTKTYKNKRKKLIFKTENILKSLYKLKEIMENNKRI